ncbi:inositol monophosphatase family protein [Candidatus Margulisiibacteriota bacterium]
MRAKRPGRRRFSPRYRWGMGFAREARQALRASVKEIKVKPDKTIVTNLDTDIDCRFRRGLRQSPFKRDQVVSEESVKRYARSHNPHRGRWILDSIDGTTNLAIGHLHYAVSLAYYEGLVPEIAFIILPEIYGFKILSAERGSGLRLNGRRFNPPTPPRVVGAMDFRRTTEDPLFRCFPELVAVGNEIRVLGSIACGLAEVAMGKLSFYLHSRPRLWDAAAGILLLQEAGRVTNVDQAMIARANFPEFRMDMVMAAQDQAIFDHIGGIVG